MSSTLAHRKTSMVSKRVAAKARKKSKKKTRKTKMDLDSAKMSGSESDDFESLNIEFDDDEPYYYMSMLDMSRRKKYLHQHFPVLQEGVESAQNEISIWCLFCTSIFLSLGLICLTLPDIAYKHIVLYALPPVVVTTSNQTLNSSKENISIHQRQKYTKRQKYYIGTLSNESERWAIGTRTHGIPGHYNGSKAKEAKERLNVKQRFYSLSKRSRNVTIQSYKIDQTIADTNLYNRSYKLLRKYMRHHKVNLDQNISNYNKQDTRTLQKQNATAAFLRSAQCITSLSKKYKFTFILIRWNYDDVILKTMHKTVCAMHNLLYGPSCIHKMFKSNDCSNIGKKAYFDFTFVSDPFQRALRAWKYHILNMEVFKRYKRLYVDEHDKNARAMIKRLTMITKMCTFEDFLNIAPRCKIRRYFDKQWPQVFLSNQMNATIVDKIGKVETFQEDMRDILTKIFGDEVFKEMKKSNITLDTNRRDKDISALAGAFQYNRARAVAMVEKKFADDMRLFDLIRL